MTIQRAYLCDCRVDISRDPQGVIRYCSSHKAAPALLAALERIAGHEYRSDRRKIGMVDVDEIETLKRTARAAIAQARGEK